MCHFTNKGTIKHRLEKVDLKLQNHYYLELTNTFHTYINARQDRSFRYNIECVCVCEDVWGGGGRYIITYTILIEE